MPTDLAEIARLLQTQDNRITTNPIFIVQQKHRVWGVDSDYATAFEWRNPEGDWDEAGDALAASLEAKDADGEDVDPWVRIGYVDHWQFVTACLTHQGCNDYIACEGHHLTEPRIYVASGYRNAEWEALREQLAEVPKLRDRAAELEALAPVGVDPELCGVALQKWGTEAQIGMLHEEIGELLQAASKYRRHPDGGTASALMFEIVDVEIMLAQLRLLFESPVSFDDALKHKQDLLRCRLAGE